MSKISLGRKTRKIRDFILDINKKIDVLGQNPVKISF